MKFSERDGFCLLYAVMKRQFLILFSHNLGPTFWSIPVNMLSWQLTHDPDDGLALERGLVDLLPLHGSHLDDYSRLDGLKGRPQVP